MGQISWLSALRSGSFPRRWWHHERIKAFLKDLPKGTLTILDLGCGTGIISRELAGRGHMVIRLDLGKQLVKSSSRNSFDFKASTEFIIADAETIPFREKSFDLVIFTEVLKHPPFPENAIPDIFRILKTEGILLLIAPRKSKFWNFAFPLYPKFRKEQLENYNSSFSLNEVGKLLIENSLKIIKADKTFSGFSWFILAKAVKETPFEGLNFKLLSVVVPAYNEEKRFPYLRQRLSTFFEQNKCQHEIIVVNNGSSDKTAELIKEWQENDSSIVLVNIKVNLGKGSGLISGFKAARGEIVLFMDADCATDPLEIPNLLSHFKDADVVVGSRSMKDSVLLIPPPLRRRFVAKVFNYITNLIFHM
ncbi:MAG: glycosyltransferase, partial [bacterium]